MRNPHKLLAHVAVAGALLALIVWLLDGNLSVFAHSAGSRSALSIRTTNPALAVRNLESLIVSHKGLLQRSPDKAAYRAKYVDLLLTHSQFLGSYDSFSEIQKLLPAQPESADDHLIIARFRSAVHDFAGARAEALKAAELEPQNERATQLISSVKLAVNEDLPALREDSLAALKDRRTFENLTFLAAIESELGNFDAAEKYYDEALAGYGDTSPFPVAYVLFQKGVMWAEKAGDSRLALPLYRESVRYLPQYVTAQVHLAEILHENGDTQGAIAALRMVERSADPEPRGLLGEILSAGIDPAAGAAAIDSARQSYDILLRDFPLAFSDHGSEFFAGAGADPKRGLEYALLNLENRRTERAYTVAIKAALAVEDAQKACELIAQARALTPAPLTAPLQSLIEEAKSCS